MHFDDGFFSNFRPTKFVHDNSRQFGQPIASLQDKKQPTCGTKICRQYILIGGEICGQSTIHPWRFCPSATLGQQFVIFLHIQLSGRIY